MSEAYERISQKRIEDVHADASFLIHKKTGARIALLSNDDKNKVFSIGFRTPPHNSTGVAHILEHSVLCGSRKFPLKDPFVELAKGSLNTFLNAMTYPDKTLYPVASYNDRDFHNLMDVYLDAVFYPNIYKEDRIFRQEGWHYELADEKDDLKINGVVYNEMKGAFSSAEEVLNRTIFNTLFPDTPYGVESGGDPEVIPSLSYEEFLDFHKTYYHPSNSFIYLYGDMDMEKVLTWLDSEYLQHFEYKKVDSDIPFQKSFASEKTITGEYPILDEESAEDRTYLTESFVVTDYRDVTKNIAWSILDYVLTGSPGAPVKQALLDAGIGKDAGGSYSDGTLQTFFSFEAKEANPEKLEEFQKVIRNTLQKLVTEGLDQKAILAGINSQEFHFREADYSRFPKGLIYGLNLFDSWLYDDQKPFSYLELLSVFEDLKEKAKEGYFEKLIQEGILDNAHSALVVLKPTKGLQKIREEKTAGLLAEKKSSLSAEDIQKLIDQTGDLKAYQSTPELPENLQKLPLLKREDLDRKTPLVLSAIEEKEGDTTLLYHDFETNGIGYLSLLFDATKVPNELTPYLGILRSCLGMVSTAHYSYAELSHEINARTGGIQPHLALFPLPENEEKKKGHGIGNHHFALQAKYLLPEQDFVFEMLLEILKTSKLNDKKRLKEILASVKTGLFAYLTSAGHQEAVQRVLAFSDADIAWQEETSGIAYYRLLEKLTSDFDKYADDLIEKLELLMRLIFRPENLLVSITAAKKELKNFPDQIRKLKAELYQTREESGSFVWAKKNRKEAFSTPGQVQYVAQGGNFKQKGFSYTGALQVLHVILNYDYLWQNLRVKGGAYGCMSFFSRNGNAALVSYRDPKLKETLEVYQNLPSYVSRFEADEREMTKYVIGTFSELDIPLNPSAKGTVSLTYWYAGRTLEEVQKEREEILDVRTEDIRALAPLLEAVLKENNISVLGSETAIENAKEIFDETSLLTS